MKSLAIWLYLIAFLVSFVLGGPVGLMFCFPVLALAVTVMLGFVAIVLSVASKLRL